MLNLNLALQASNWKSLADDCKYFNSLHNRLFKIIDLN